MATTEISFRINTGDSVKSLSDLKKEFKEIQKQLSGLTPDTKEYIQALKDLGAVKDEIGDLKDEINAFAGADKKIAAVTNLVGGLAGGFQAAQGAAALFGADNEALNETMVKLQATMAITQGIQGLAGMGDSLSAVGNLLKSTTIGTKAIAAAQYIWNNAIKANPIMAIITAIGALVTGIVILTRTMGDETEAQEESIKQRKKELELMNETAEKLKNENKFRLDLAAAQGKSAKELAAINEAQSANEIKSIDKRIKQNTKLFLENYALMKERSGEELKQLQDDNSKILAENKKLADERLAIQNSLKIQEAKLNTDANKEKETKDKEAADKKKERDLAAAEFYRQSEQKFIDYSIEALSNKFGDAEQLIAKQRIETRIALGYATPQEIEAYNAFKLKQEVDYQTALDTELKRLSDEQNKRREENNAKIQAEFEAEKKRRDDEKAMRKRNAEFAIQSTQEALTTIQSLTDAFAGKSEESQRKAFNVKKAASLAQTTIETYLAAQSAFASQVVPGDPTSPIRGAIAAGLAIASGLARVAVIAKTKFEGGGAGATGGGGGGNLGSFSQGGGGQPPQGLTAQNTVTQLNPDGSVAGQGERNAAPMKAYVVESESRAVTERVNKLSNNSKIG